MIRTRTLALTLAASLLTPAAWAGGDNWQADFDAAARIAKEQGKDLLVDFTGSDWCGWCIRLDEEVFAHDEFLTEATKHYVLTALDYPSGEEAKAKVPNPRRNEELKNKYGIRGFPTILLMTPEGEVYGETGYREGGPEAYVKHLEELRSQGRAALDSAKKLVAEFEAAEGDARVAVFERVLAAMESTEGPVANLYVPVAKEAMAMDPDGSKGIKHKALGVLLDAGQTDAEIIEAAVAADPKNEKGLFRKAVEARMDSVASAEDVKAACTLIDRFTALGDIQDEELARKIYINAAWWNHQVLNNADAAKTYAAKAKALLTDDDQRLLDMLDGILGS